MLVLETDACVDLLRRHPPTIEAVRAMQDTARLAVTAVTVHELVEGANRAQDSMRHRAMVERFLSAFGILEFNGAAAWISGRLAADLLDEGNPIGEYDTMIAAVTIAHGGMLVTRNLKHYGRVGGLALRPLS